MDLKIIAHCLQFLTTAREGNVFTGVCLSTISLMPTGSLLGLVMVRSVRIVLECFLVWYFISESGSVENNLVLVFVHKRGIQNYVFKNTVFFILRGDFFSLQNVNNRLRTWPKLRIDSWPAATFADLHQLKSVKSVNRCLASVTIFHRGFPNLWKFLFGN